MTYAVKKGVAMNKGVSRERVEELQARARRELAEIPPQEIQQLLAKSRWTCDSNWMMAMVMTAGWDIANQANHEVARAVGKAEMHRLMRLLELETPRNDEEFAFMIFLAMENFITEDYWEYEAGYLGPGTMVAIVHQCYANTKTRSIGVDKEYRCGCFGMRAGWYEAMGVDVEERLIKCLKNGDSRCEILVSLKEFAPAS